MRSGAALYMARRCPRSQHFRQGVNRVGCAVCAASRRTAPLRHLRWTEPIREPMSEISSPRPLPPSAPVIRSTATAADMAVRLLQPLEGMLAAGESAKAEVIAVREQAQSFQLLLKLTLEGGRQATVQADSSRPLAQGTALTVTALSDTRLSVLLQPGGDKALTKLDLQQLPPGTLVQARSSATLRCLRRMRKRSIAWWSTCSTHRWPATSWPSTAP